MRPIYFINLLFKRYLSVHSHRSTPTGAGASSDLRVFYVKLTVSKVKTHSPNVNISIDPFSNTAAILNCVEIMGCQRRKSTHCYIKGGGCKSLFIAACTVLTSHLVMLPDRRFLT